jgi:hypothetical protein
MPITIKEQQPGPSGSGVGGETVVIPKTKGPNKDVDAWGYL